MSKGICELSENWGVAELQLALSSVYDKNLFEEIIGSTHPIADLAAQVLLNTRYQDYLLHLAKYDWDVPSANLAWL